MSGLAIARNLAIGGAAGAGFIAGLNYADTAPPNGLSGKLGPVAGGAGVIAGIGTLGIGLGMGVAGTPAQATLGGALLLGLVAGGAATWLALGRPPQD